MGAKHFLMTLRHIDGLSSAATLVTAVTHATVLFDEVISLGPLDGIGRHAIYHDDLPVIAKSRQPGDVYQEILLEPERRLHLASPLDQERGGHEDVPYL
jgi:hypothetical protein